MTKTSLETIFFPLLKLQGYNQLLREGRAETEVQARKDAV